MFVNPSQIHLQQEVSSSHYLSYFSSKQANLPSLSILLIKYNTKSHDNLLIYTHLLLPKDFSGNFKPRSGQSGLNRRKNRLMSDVLDDEQVFTGPMNFLPSFWSWRWAVEFEGTLPRMTLESPDEGRKQNAGACDMKVLEDWAGLREALNYTGSCSSPSLNSHCPGEQMRTPLILSKPLIHTQ